MQQYDSNSHMTMKQAEIKRNSQVSEQLQTQEKLISELALNLDSLERALEVVIRQIPKAIEQEEKEELLVPLAINIRTNNRFIINNIHRIQTLINTIEL